MILTVAEMIALLRDSVNVQIKGSEVTDSAYLVMSDADLELYIKLGCSRAYPDITSLEDLESGSEYPIILLAKIELYSKLAVLKADKIDLTADNNNQLKQSQRFEHYMKLVRETTIAYENWVKDDSMGKVQSYNTILVNNSLYRGRNYEMTPTPKVKIVLGTITNESVELSWEVTNITHFGHYLLYISKAPIIDMYKEGSRVEDKIDSDAILLRNTYDIKNNSHRVQGLLPSTTYYVAVLSVERNLIFGYQEKTFTTLETFTVQEEVNNTTI